jgi:ABC-type sulfate/molybdate transport systems ATPase subunit
MDIRFEDVRFRREGRDVVSIPSLHIGADRVTAILGPNGAGKTTLLRLIAALDRPHSGRVLVGGAVADTRRRCVSLAFQEEVFLRRSLLENLVLGLTIRGSNRGEAHDRAMTTLGLLEIDSLADRRVDQISGGEGRRASLARALCLHAPVLLLDEPMAGLDGNTYARLLDELPGLVGHSGATAVVVTHNPEEAFRLCDDIVILVNGRVRAAGAKRDVATNPGFRDVAEILGYTVVTVSGRLVAIPENALSPAAGPTELSATVDAVLDLVHDWDVIATIGTTRVHIRVPRAEIPPQRGDRIYLNARVMYDLS